MDPGSEFAGFEIDGVEREHAGAVVLRAREPGADRAVVLHIVRDPPGTLAAVRFLERARRLGDVDHAHLLEVYETRTVDADAIAVAEAPAGRRLDDLLADGSLGPASAVRVARQVASAVDALEQAGAEPPPLTADRIWVDERGDACLDGLDAQFGPGSPVPSSSASLAELLLALTPRLPPGAEAVVERARDGAYLSSGQLAEELHRIEAGGLRRRRAFALAVLLVATLGLLAIIAASLIG